MHKYGIKPLRRRIKIFKKEDVNTPEIEYINVFKMLCPLVVNVVWVSDFIYIQYHGRFVYLAVVQEYISREVLGIAISRYHDRNLVIEALLNTFERGNTGARYIHSDQGSEYRSREYTELCNNLGLTISMSDKGSPWQNGQMESFFGRFKAESGDLNRFSELVELISYIYQQVYYYNNERIHTSLGMSPKKY